MDNRAARKVERAQITQPAANAPYPVRHGVVQKRSPQKGKQHKRAKFKAFGVSAGNKRRRNYRKHALECRKGKQRHRCGIFFVRSGEKRHIGKPCPAQAADNAVNIRPKGKAEAEQHPLHAYHCHNKKALHNCCQYVFAAHHAAVKKRQPRCHQHYKRSTYQYPRRVAGINCRRSFCGKHRARNTQKHACRQ